MNEKILKLMEEYIEIEESEIEFQDVKLAMVGHEIDHAVLDSKLIAITNKTEEYKEILRLTVEDANNSYFIPVFTSEDEAEKCIEEMGLDSLDFDYELEVMEGIDIFEIGLDDETFVGLVINPYDTDFIVPKEDLLHTNQCNHNSSDVNEN